MRLSSQIEVRSAYYAITPGLPQQPSFVAFELSGIEVEQVFCEVNLSFVRNREIDSRPSFFLYSMNVSLTKHGEVTQEQHLTNQTVNFPFERIQSQIVPLVSTNSIDFDSVSAVVGLGAYEPSAMGIQVAFGFIPSSGAASLRLFGLFCCIPVVLLVLFRYPFARNRMSFLYGFFCVMAIDPLKFFREATSNGLFFDKLFGAGLRHFFRHLILLLFRVAMRPDDVHGRRYSRYASLSYLPFLLADIATGVDGLLEMGTNKAFRRHVPFVAKLSIVGEIWFCCIGLFVATKKLSLHLPKYQKRMLTSALFQTGMHSIAIIAMLINHEFLPSSAEVMATVMYVVHGGLFLWTFRPGVGFDPALVPSAKYAQPCSE
jgi:hypothetical protein